MRITSSERYEFGNYMTAREACHVADIVILNFQGGHRIAKGVDLLREIRASDEAREVAIAEVDVCDLGEAKAIRDLLARAAA